MQRGLKAERCTISDAMQDEVTAGPAVTITWSPVSLYGYHCSVVRGWLRDIFLFLPLFRRG